MCRLCPRPQYAREIRLRRIVFARRACNLRRDMGVERVERTRPAAAPPIGRNPVVELTAQVSYLAKIGRAGVRLSRSRRDRRAGGEAFDDDLDAHVGAQAEIFDWLAHRLDRALQRAGLVAAPARDRDPCVFDREMVASSSGLPL